MTIERRLPHIVLSFLTVLVIAGCGGGGSSAAPAPPPPPPADTTAPTVSAVQAPAATVNRTVTLTLTASDNVGVTAVRFFVDGVLLGTDTAAAYSMAWDTSGETEGDHTLTAEAEDAAGNVGQAAAVTVTVQNVLMFTVAPSGQEEVPASGSQASAQANLTINVASGAMQGSMTTSGITATAAHIHDAFAGTNGPVLIPLDQDAGDPAIFNVPGGATLDAAGVDRLLAGALYLNVHSAAAPGGEIRGQILPGGFELLFTDLAGAASVPQVDSPASGRAATTLDTSTGVVVIHAQITGLDDATQAHLHQAYAGATGPVLVALAKDAADPGHWSAEGETLNAAAFDAFSNGELYVNVHSSANPGGEIRGQVLPDGITVLFTDLSGEQEVPTLNSSADGLASLTLDEGGAIVTIHVNTRGLDDASGAHLHNAFGGTNGSVEIGLTQDGGNPAHWFAEQQTLSAAQLDALTAGATYINVHSPAQPGGEIRGQVIPEGIVFAFGRLDGSQRVPAVATAASGTFAITGDPDAGILVAHVNTSGVDDATAAHLHDGYAGSNGGVAIGLTQDPGNVALWSAAGTPVDAAQLAALRSGRYYVNVHTPANPGGEIRGQVTTESIEVLFTAMSGGQEVPTNASAASAVAASTVDLETGAISLHLNATGADTATASHIHLGFAGTNGDVLIALGPDAGDPGHWFVDGAQLDDAGLASYQEGQLYVNLHTPTNPGGEIRGQIVPPDAANFDNVDPAVSLSSPGSPISDTVTLTADASDNQGVVEVRFLVDGSLIATDTTAPYSVDWMTTTVANGEVTLTAEAEDAAGNVGVSADVVVTVQNTAPVTLSMIQAQVFTPICSGCHSGPTSDSLPSGMNLSSTGNSFLALVNAPSLQVDTLNRVTPGDTANSYLIQKLEGTATEGSRMPQGGPFLDQATMDMIKQWINDDAPNN